MERWVLEGDSYSFLRSAPQMFNLQSREGPNRVEIFDITSIPNHHNAISETTCLCDIFGDDGESPSLSSSPASATFVRREVDQPFPADDANDSSGSYHTANGSDLSDNIEVTYSTPSPKNMPHFSTSETRESESHQLPDETNILSDSKNGLNPLDCTPPAMTVNVNDLSHTGNTWEEPQVSESTTPVNKTKITNASELQDIDSTPAINQINPENYLSEATSCPSEEKEPATFEQEEIITAPQHTSTSPFLDKQDYKSIFKSTNCESLAESPLEQNNIVSSENKEHMNYHSPQEENVLLAQRMINSDSTSELSNTSPTDCCPIQEMSTSPTNRDINILPILRVMPELRLNSISPVSKEISSRPASGRSSPELLGLYSNQVGNTPDSPYLEDTYGASSSVSTLPTSDNLEIDSLSVSALSTETRELVCLSIDGRVSLESPEINETCSSPDHSVPAYSPEPVTIHSPVGYTISPSPKNETIISSTEPEALPSCPVSTRIDYRDICSLPDHSVPAYSPEPVMIHSPVGYTISPSPKNETIISSTEPNALPSCPVSTRIDYRDICSLPDHPEPAITRSFLGYISPSPTNERGVYSTETEASTSSPCCHSDIYPSSDHSVSAHSSEPAIIHSPMSYTISQSPTNERMVYLTEPDDLPSSPVITGNYYRATPTCSRDSTPALRSITSTPNSREHYLTPEPLSPAPSLELRSVTCSPEIKTISYSILPQNTKSPVISGIRYNVSPNEDLVQSPEVSPTARNFLSTPENRSRPSSTASDHSKDTALSPDLQTEPSIPLEKAESQPLPIIFEGIHSPSPNPIDSDNFHDLADTEPFKSSASVADECTGGPQILGKILQDLPSESLDSGLSTVNMEQNQETVSDNTTDLTVCGTPASPWASSFPMLVTSVDKKQCYIEDYYGNKGTEILENDRPSNDKRHSLLPVALRESPGVIIKDSGGKFDSQPCREKESGKREGEEEETMRDSSYRGQQVELSFSARNRKGPADLSPALSSRDSKSGIPAGCYFESYPTTLQQQSQLKAQGSQQENKGGARRLQSTAQGKYSSAGFLPPECTGENSYSMGSEFDEADNEVKWFTDLAFRSLSSPQVDYLDVYNSSHRSSTNVSQPSTVDSPGAVAWMTYADLRGSALHENDGSCTLPRDSLDPNKHFEMGSFECVDVALESKEESSRRKRTVPKRQIQLLRRNTDESKHKGNIENVLDSPSTSRHSQVNLVRQHSTPAFVQEEVSKELPDSQQNDRKRILQKSLSLDDGSPKTQMASCIIKSVLSKKMQDVQKKTSKSADPSPSGDENKRLDVSPSSFDGVPSNMEGHILNSSQQSECSLLSKDFALGEERISHRPLKKCAPKVPPKPFLRPAFLNTGETQVAGNITKEETKPIVALTSVDDKIQKQNSKSEGKGGGRDSLGGKYNGDSPNACARNTSPVVATPAINMQSKMTRRDTKRQTTPVNQEQLAGKSVFMSKTPEITLKPSSIKGKKTSSLKVSLSPDIEHSREMSESQSMEIAAEDMSTKSSPKETETEEYDDSNKKSVIHKVRDVRKLVKNTYNLSFKASNSTSTEDTVIQEKRDQPPKTPPALHIECKAISWKDKQTSSSKTNHCNFEKQPVDTTKISQPLVDAKTRDADVTETTSKGYSPKSESLQKVAESNSKNINGLPDSDSITKRSYIHCDSSTKMPPRPPSKEREISALVVLPDGTSTSKTFDLAIPDSTQMEATNNSHSVSMLLKEKGMQADIGVCDVLTEGTSATAKHVNRLEVPVQACSSEVFSTEAQVRSENIACSPTALVDNSSSIFQQSENPKVTLTEDSTKEQEKKKMTTTMTQNPTYLATSVKPEVRTFANSTKNNTTPVNASKEIELPIQVRSISTDRLKPFVPQKPSYKQSFAEIRSVSSDPPKADAQASSVIKHQTRLSSESKKNEMPTVMHKDQPNKASSRDTKRLAVSAISSCKPPPIPVTTTQSTVQKSTTMTLASLDQHQSSAFFQNTSSCQQQTPSFSQDHSTLDISVASNSSGAQALGHTQSVTRASDNNRFHTDDFLFYASDDPPSYDERESFSPLRMSDLTPQRSCRYHPTTKQSPCSCTLSSHSHQGHPQHNPHERIPAASRSPGQVLTCPGAPPQAQVRPQQSRADALPVSNTTIPHGSALIQPLHNPRTCPVSNSQSYSDDQPTTSGLHSDRRPANHPSPQPAASAPYHEYSHSANISALDPRPQLFNPQDLPPSFGHDYSNEGPGGAGVLYPENTSGLNCGQGPRRVLLDPETGKYFYIEVPMQPLRKMLFDPELGQYVEVLIPQQAMSHSGLYPPAAPPYSSLHSPGLYAPQYLPYAVPSYPAIPGSAQQVRHPEPHPVPTTLQQTSLRYGSPASQMPKNEPKGHSSMDPSYLESMYYIPTGMNASPNSTPSDCYHKAPSSMPPSGGRRA